MNKHQYDIGVRLTGDAKGAEGAINKVDQSLGRLGKNAGGSGLGSFTDGISEAKDALGSFLGPAGAVVGTITGIAATTIGAGSALFALAKRTADLGVEIDNFNKLTGFSVETVQGLKIAAEKTGGSLGQIEEVFESFVELMNEGGEGAEDAVKKIKSLGLDPQTAFKDLEGSFLKVLDKIREMPTQSQKAKVAMDGMGESGLAMIKVADAMTGGTKEYIKTLKESGQVMDSEGVQKSREFQNALGGLTKQAEGAINTFTLRFMPEMTKVMDEMSNFLRDNKESWASWGDTIAAIMRGVSLAAKKESDETSDSWTASLGKLVTDTAVNVGNWINEMNPIYNWAVGIREAGEKDIAREKQAWSNVTRAYGEGWEPFMKRRKTTLSPTSSGGKSGASKTDKYVDDRVKAQFQSAMRNLSPAMKSQITAAAESFGIPTALAFAHIFSESSFKTKAVSPYNKNVGSSAYGLTQQLPSTASRQLGRKVSGKDLFDPRLALSAWGKYMTFLFNRYGDWELAALAYHQGEGEVDKLIKILDKGKSSEVFFKTRPKGKAYLNKISALLGLSGDARFKPAEGKGEELIKTFDNQIARLNATTIEQNLLLDIAEGKYGNLTPAIIEAAKAKAQYLDQDAKEQKASEEFADFTKKLTESYKVQNGVIKTNVDQLLEQISAVKAAGVIVDDFGNSMLLWQARRLDWAETDRKLTDAALDYTDALRAERDALFDLRAAESEARGGSIGIQSSTHPRIVGQEDNDTPPELRDKSFSGGLFGSAGISRLKSEADEITSIYQFMGGKVGEVMAGMTAAAESTLAGYILTGEAGGQIFAQLASQIIASLAVQSAVKAVFETAEGFAALARYDFKSAGEHFTSAAIYGTVAGAAAGVGIAIGASGGLAGNKKDQSGSPDYQTVNSSNIQSTNQNLITGNSAQQQQINQVAEAINNLSQRIGTEKEGVLVKKGIQQNPGLIGSTVVSDIKRNSTLKSETGKALGLS